jgi:hypothetical protein
MGKECSRCNCAIDEEFNQMTELLLRHEDSRNNRDIKKVEYNKII